MTTRTIYVLRSDELVPKHVAPPLPGRSSPNVMPDIAEFRTIGGEVIGSRSALRAYEQRTGTRQVGNDFKSLTRKIRETQR